MGAPTGATSPQKLRHAPDKRCLTPARETCYLLGLLLALCSAKFPPGESPIGLGNAKTDAGSPPEVIMIRAFWALTAILCFCFSTYGQSTKKDAYGRPYKSDGKLLRAARQGNAKEVRDLLRKGAATCGGVPQSAEEQPMFLAAQSGNLDTVRAFLERTDWTICRTVRVLMGATCGTLHSR